MTYMSTTKDRLVSMLDSALLIYVLLKGAYKSIVYSFLQPSLRGPLWK